MSHVSRVAIVIQDLDALEKACAELGLILHRNKTEWKWYGRWVNDYNADDAAYHHGIKPEDYGKGDHCISVNPNNPNCHSHTYEVGVVKNPNGAGHVLVYDNYQGGMGLEAVIGKNAGKLVQEYAATAAMKVARKQGWRAQRTVREDGTVRVKVTR